MLYAFFAADDGLVEDTCHATFRGELGYAQGILLPLVGVAVNVDGIVDADHLVEGWIDGPLFEAAAGGIRCHRANRARRRIVGSGLSHGQSS